MLERWLSTAGCVVACSIAVWPGCGGSEDSAGNAGAHAGDGEDGGSSHQDSGTGSNLDGSSNGDSGLPPVVPIQYGTCPTFTPCGGDVIGTWTVSGGCLSEDAFAAAKKPPCEGLQESDVVSTGTGVVIASATRIQRKMSFEISAKLAVPQACAAQAGGSCALVQAGLTSATPGSPPRFDKATCTSDGAGGCNCSVSKTSSSNTDSEYTVAGNTLTSTDPTRTFDYCVAGNKHTFKETTDGVLPFVIELAK